MAQSNSVTAVGLLYLLLGILTLIQLGSESCARADQIQLRGTEWRSICEWSIIVSFVFYLTGVIISLMLFFGENTCCMVIWLGYNLFMAAIFILGSLYIVFSHSNFGTLPAAFFSFAAALLILAAWKNVFNQLTNRKRGGVYSKSNADNQEEDCEASGNDGAHWCLK